MQRTPVVLHVQGTAGFKHTLLLQYADFSYLYSGMKYLQINYLDWAVWMKGISLYSLMCYSDNIIHTSCFPNSCLLNHDCPNTETRQIVRRGFTLAIFQRSENLLLCIKVEIVPILLLRCFILNPFVLFESSASCSRCPIFSLPPSKSHQRAQTFRVFFPVTFMSGVLQTGRARVFSRSEVLLDSLK